MSMKSELYAEKEAAAAAAGPLGERSSCRGCGRMEVN